MDFCIFESQRHAHLPSQLVEAEAAYLKSMANLQTSSPEPKNLHELHDHSIQSALETIATSHKEPLPHKVRQSIQTILDPLITHYQQIQRASPAIGIDLGTTNCCVAVYDSGNIRIIKNDIGPSNTPSFVAFHNNGNEPVAGDVAKKLAHAYPQTTIFDIKRLLGQQFDDPNIQKSIQSQQWPFELAKSTKQNATVGEILVKTGENDWRTVEEILSYLIKYLKKTAEEALDAVVVNAVVAVPVNFTPRQKQLTVKACELAGLNVVQLVSEPVATAIAYNELKNVDKIDKNPPLRNLLIFDLGGGTFDASVLTIQNNEITTKATGGDNNIGGQVFDGKMVDYCVQEFERKHNVSLDLFTNKNAADLSEKIKILNLRQQLKGECEMQKRFFTHINKVWVKVDGIQKDQDLNISISRDTFESVNVSLFQKCMEIVEKVIYEAACHKNQIDDIVLVGGSSKILRVQQMLTELFGGKELWLADEAVAVGAAVLASYTENPKESDIRIPENEGTTTISSLALKINKSDLPRNFTEPRIESAPPLPPRKGSLNTGFRKPVPLPPSNILEEPEPVVDSKQIVPESVPVPTVVQATPALCDKSETEPLEKIATRGTQDNRRNSTRPLSNGIQRNLPPIDISGYLRKKVLELDGKPITGKKSDWENVFVALRDQHLYVWPADISLHRSEDKASLIDIELALCDAKDYLGSKRSFILKLSTSQYQFLAESPAVIEKWVDKIRQHSNIPSTIVGMRSLKGIRRYKHPLNLTKNQTNLNTIAQENTETSHIVKSRLITTKNLLNSESLKANVIACNSRTQITIDGHIPRIIEVVRKSCSRPCQNHPGWMESKGYRLENPGSTLIINNVFDGPGSDPGGIRVGAEKDYQLIFKLFKDTLNNDVTSCRNVASTDLDRILNSFKQKCVDSGSSYCAVIIMSHGGDPANSILMNDIKAIDFYQHIFNKFNHDNFPAFQSKPKLFFVECCDGSQDLLGGYKDGVPVLPFQVPVPSESECRRVEHGMILDSFVSRASYPCSRAYRDVGEGSYYFQAIHSVFGEFWKSKDLKALHDLVRETISETWGIISKLEGWPSEWNLQQPMQINELRFPFLFSDNC